MERVRIRADQFCKQGKLQEEDIEAIIWEMKEELEEESGNQASGGTRAEEHS
jgi:hypothetical protein